MEIGHGKSRLLVYRERAARARVASAVALSPADLIHDALGTKLVNHIGATWVARLRAIPESGNPSGPYVLDQLGAQSVMDEISRREGTRGAVSTVISDPARDPCLLYTSDAADE